MAPRGDLPITSAVTSDPPHASLPAFIPLSTTTLRYQAELAPQLMARLPEFLAGTHDLSSSVLQVVA